MDQSDHRRRRMSDRWAGSVCQVHTERRIFHLSFDDGPHPEVTPSVLEVLDEFDAPASFFVLTDHALRSPDVVGETFRQGHEVGLHGRTHQRLSDASWRSLLDEVGRARRDLEEVAGRPVGWFRPPYGDHGYRSRVLVRALGMRSVLWSVDTYDWREIPRGASLQEIIAALQPGGIGLIHDTPIGSVAEEKERGLLPKEELTRELLTGTRDRGLRPVSLVELLASGREVRRFHPVT